MDGYKELPEGAYIDDDEMLRDKDGNYLPDGCYQTADGDVLMYEGDSLSRIIND